MKFIKNIETLLAEIAIQLKRNANEAEKQSELLQNINSDGIGGIKISANGITLTSSLNSLENEIRGVPTENKTQEMIEKEIEYQNELKDIKEKYPEMLEFITTISTNYAKLDKYGILDAVRMFSEDYVIYKNKETE